METAVIVEMAADSTFNEDAGYMNRVFIGSLPKWVRLPNVVMKIVLSCIKKYVANNSRFNEDI